MKVSREIAELVPYVTGKPISETKREFNLETVIKLASNENPLGPSPKALKAIVDHAAEIHRYPDPNCYELTQALSQLHGVDAKGMVMGNGSNELIDLLIRVFCAPGEKILTSEVAFVAYRICAQAARVQAIEVPLKEDFRFDVEALLEAEAKHRPRIVFLPNPNNPTGQYLRKSEMERLLKAWSSRSDLLVVIDEAYLEFVRAPDYPNGLDLLKSYANVAVMHTFSKAYGLAGLRLGVLYAQPEIADYLHRVRNPFNVNSLAQAAVLATLEDTDYLKASQTIVWQGLDEFYSHLTRLGLPFVPSQGNFVLFDTLREASLVYEQLLRRGLILRPVKSYGLARHLRMSVGLQPENQAAMNALREVLPIVSPLPI